MSQAPAMPLWTDALIGDTTHLSAEEFGCYLLLLIATWRNNGEPFADHDEVRLARICRVTTAKWRTKIRASLVGFYNLSDGAWRQKRLEKEWNFAAELRAKNSLAGKASAAAKSQKNNETTATSVAATLQPKGQQNGNPLDLDHKEGSEGIEPSAAEAAPARLKPDATTVVAFQPKPVPPDPKKELYDLGREALGAGYGGQVTKLIRHHDSDIPAALYTMRQVAKATNPAEYLGRILGGEASAPFDTAAFYRAHGIRPDGTSVGDDTWLPLTQRPGTDENGNPCDQWGNPWVGPVKASR